MLSLNDILETVKRRLIERTVYTRNLEQFEVYASQVPPIMAPGIAGSTVFNTENLKKSVYLSKKSDPSGKWY